MNSVSDDEVLQTAAQSGGSPLGFALTVLIGCLNNAPLMSARLILPMVAMSMGASATSVGIIASLFTAVPIAFNVGFGRWVDRSGTLMPMIFASLLIGFASMLPVLHASPSTLMVSAGLIGAGTVFAHVVATRAVGEIGPPAQRTRNLGILIAAYSLFQFAGPMIAGVAFERYGRDWAFVTLAVSSILALCGLGLPWHFYARWRVTAGTAAPKPRMRELLGNAKLARWLGVGGITSGVVTIFPFIVAMQAADIGMSAPEAGLVLGAFAIGNAVSRLLSGPISRRASPHIAISWMLGSGGILYAALPSLSGFVSLAVLGAMLGLTLGMAVPFVLSVLYAAAPPGRVNEVIGLSMTASNSIQAALPLSVGFLANHFGGPVMPWLVTLLMVLALPLVLRG